MYDQRKAAKLKWSMAGFITLVNISVYCFWVPARLQINERYIHLNDIWDRAEKVIYAVCDGGLNFWFLHHVRKNFILNGMTKYKPLFKFNAYAVVISLSMDVSLALDRASAKRLLILIDYVDWNHEPEEQLHVSWDCALVSSLDSHIG